MLPHEKALVKRLANEPFALLGVNGDGEADRVLPLLQAEGITWRNAMDITYQGEWNTKWNINRWPALFLIDAKGIIRQKWAGAPGEESSISASRSCSPKPRQSRRLSLGRVVATYLAPGSSAGMPMNGAI